MRWRRWRRSRFIGDISEVVAQPSNCTTKRDAPVAQPAAAGTRAIGLPCPSCCPSDPHQEVPSVLVYWRGEGCPDPVKDTGTLHSGAAEHFPPKAHARQLLVAPEAPHGVGRGSTTGALVSTVTSLSRNRNSCSKHVGDPRVPSLAWVHLAAPDPLIRLEVGAPIDVVTGGAATIGILTNATLAIIRIVRWERRRGIREWSRSSCGIHSCHSVIFTPLQ